MCGSMADIQSATAEIRRGKKERKKEETTGQKYNGLPCVSDHNQADCSELTSSDCCRNSAAELFLIDCSLTPFENSRQAWASRDAWSVFGCRSRFIDRRRASAACNSCLPYSYVLCQQQRNPPHLY